MTPNVFRPNEISLFNVFYPIVGAVKVTALKQFPPKQVTGDVTIDSDPVLSSWSISDQRGGIGIKDMVEDEDYDRCEWSTCYIDAKGHVVLPALVTEASNPTTDDPAVTIEYSNEQYVAFATSARKWNEGTGAFGSNLKTLVATPTDTIIHKSKLYFACGSDFDRFDGSTWTKGATLGSAQPSRYFVEWDEKLFALDNDGQLDYSVDEGVTWVTNALSHLPSSFFTSLWTADNAAGENIIYMGTKEGPYALDFDNAKWRKVRLEIPLHDYGCLGADKWRGNSFIPVGLALYKYDAVSGKIEVVGPDRDYGIPADYWGNIVKVASGHNGAYVLIDATSTETQDLFPASFGNVFGNVQIYDNLGYSSVLKYTEYWNEKKARDVHSWSVIYLSSALQLPGKCMSVSTADNLFRLWFGVAGTMYYVPLQQSIQNPLEVADFKFDSTRGGEHITTRFDADNATVHKTGSKVTVHARDTSATEYIKVSYRIDDGTAWTLLTNTSFADGQIDSDGEHEFTFASAAGIDFLNIQFKYDLASGSTSESPDVRWVRLAYIPVLDTRWQFGLRVDCTRNYRHQTAKAMQAALKTALDTRTFGAFTFRNGNGTESHNVRLSQMAGAEIGGKRAEGVQDLVLIAP